MNMYILPKKRNIKQIQDKNKEFNHKFNEKMKNKRLTNYPEIKDSVINNIVKYSHHEKEQQKDEIQTRL